MMAGLDSSERRQLLEQLDPFNSLYRLGLGAIQPNLAQEAIDRSSEQRAVERYLERKAKFLFTECFRWPHDRIESELRKVPRRQRRTEDRYWSLDLPSERSYLSLLESQLMELGLTPDERFQADVVLSLAKAELHALAKGETTPRSPFSERYGDALLAIARSSYHDGDWDRADSAYDALASISWLYGELRAEIEHFRKEWREVLRRRANLEDAQRLPARAVLVRSLSAEGDAFRFHLGDAEGLIDLVLMENGVEASGGAKNLPAALTKLRSAQTIVVGKEAADSDTLAALRELWPRALIVPEHSAETVQNIGELAGRTIRPESLGTAVLLPKDQRQLVNMGLRGRWSESLRREVWAQAERFVKSADLRLITSRTNDTGFLSRFWDWREEGRGAERLLAALEEEEGVLIVYAHGNRDSLFLPDGSRLTVQDIRKRRFPKRPVVILVSCEGGNVREKAPEALASALRASGARAVLAFETPVDAREGIVLATKLVEALERGASILQAFREAAAVLRPQERVRTRLIARLEEPGLEAPI